MEQQVKVEIVPHYIKGFDGPVESWAARIGGIEIPLSTYAIEPGSGGEVFVSLVVEASSVAIADPATPLGVEPRVPLPSQPEKPRRVWGDPSTPDPRASLPGWQGPRSADLSADTEGRLA